MEHALSDPANALLAGDEENGALIRSDKVDRILEVVRGHLGMEIAFVSRYVEGEQREFTHISTDLPLPHKPGLREPREDSYCWHILN